ncbi:MAG: hypothetical protein IPP40_09095, partial [bacterium]|nr:hypothetical protein [bacterium]
MLEPMCRSLTCRTHAPSGDHERPPMGMGGGDDDFGGVGGMRGGKMRRGEGMPRHASAKRGDK